MSRSPLVCPRCHVLLAHARRSGTIVPRPGVALGWRDSDNVTILLCPRPGCGGTRSVLGRPIITTSRRVL
jgi:Zn-finger nucleic acid-binding protein